VIRSAIGEGACIRYEDGKYSCPKCGSKYADGYAREKAIAKNKRGYAWRRCTKCKSRFGIGVCMVDGLKGFDLSEAT